MATRPGRKLEAQARDPLSWGGVSGQTRTLTDRLAALTRYPQDAPLGFDRSEYIALCEEHRARSDRYRSAKEARGFRRPGGRRAQRAYFDAVRDLAMPALGFAPVVRIPVFDDDGAAAYQRERQALRGLLGLL